MGGRDFRSLEKSGMGNGSDFIEALCREKHKVIEKEFEAVWKRMNGTEKKLWAIIILLVGNLAGLIGMLIKSF